MTFNVHMHYNSARRYERACFESDDLAAALSAVAELVQQYARKKTVPADVTVDVDEGRWFVTAYFPTDTT